MLARFGRLVALVLLLATPALAEDFDWRTVGGGFITPVRSQDGGTCWCYAGTANLESRLMLTRGDASWKPDLAEHQIVNLSSRSVTYDSGGWPYYVYEYAQSSGVLMDAEYPSRTSTLPTDWQSRVCKIDGGYSTWGGTSVDTIKSYLKTYGPVPVDLYSGDLGTNIANLPVKSGTALDHSVLIVGFHDDPSMAEGGYWIFKNSWGTGSGNQGYYYGRYNIVQNSHVLTGRAYFTGPLASTTWNGGSGTWSNNTTGWTATVNSSKWRNGEDAATFSSGSGTITVGASTSAHGLMIAAGAVYTFAGGGLTITGGGMTADESATFSTPLTAGYDQAWSVAVGKTLTVQNLNLHINAVRVAGDGNTDLTGVVSDVTTNAMFAGLLTGSTGSLAKSGLGTLTLGHGVSDTTANTYAGQTTVTGGLMLLSKSVGTNAVPAKLSIGNGAEAATVRLISGEQIADTATVVVDANGTFDLADQHETIGALDSTISGGTVLLGSATLTVAGSASTTYRGTIQGTGGIVKAGSGTLTLAGNSTFAGGTVIAAGAVQVASDAALGALPATPAPNLHFTAGGSLKAGAAAVVINAQRQVEVDAGATASFDSNGYTLEIAGAVQGEGRVTKTGNGTLILSASNTYSGGTTIAAGTLRLPFDAAIGAVPGSPGTNLTFSGNGTLQAGASLTLSAQRSLWIDGGTATFDSNGNSLVIAGTIAGSGSISKVGAGTLTLGHANSYAGPTSVSAGTLKLRSVGALPDTTALTLSSGTTLDLNGCDTVVASLTGSGAIALGTARLGVGNPSSSTYSGVISGAGGLTKVGSGTLTLSGVNTYSSETRIDAGTLKLGTGKALPANGEVTVGMGGTLNLQSYSNDTASALRLLALTGGTLRVPSGTGNYYLTQLSMTGGTVDVTGTSNFRLRFVQAGSGIVVQASDQVSTLTAAGTSRLYNVAGGALPITVAAGTTPAGVDLDVFTYFDGSNASNRAVTKDGAGVMRVNNSASNVNFTVKAGTLRVDDATFASLGSGTLTLDGGQLYYGGVTTASTSRAITLGSGGGAMGGCGARFTGVLSGSGGLTITAGADLTLAATNTYAGKTVLAGTLAIQAETALGPNPTSFTSDQLKFDGGTLHATATSAIDDSRRGVTIGTGGGSISVDANATLTVATPVVGNGALHKVGSGMLVLSEANNYEGMTSVEAGTLMVTNTAGSATGSGAVTVAAAATLGGTGVIAGQMNLNGMLTGGEIGTVGTLTINNTLSFTSTANAVFDVVSASSYDKVEGLTGATFAGMLTLRGVVNNTTYQLFSFASGSGGGSFSSIVLPSGLSGSFNSATGVLTLGTLGPTTRYWTGGDANPLDSNMGTAANWDGVLATGDSLVFGAAGTSKPNPVNETTRNVAAVTFATGGYTLSSATGAEKLTVAGSVTANASATISAPLELAGAGGPVAAASGATLTVSGSVSGTNGLTKTGAGVVELTAASNSYTGNTAAAEGTLKVTAGIDLNAATDDTIVGTTGGSPTVAELITEHIRQDTLTINAGSKVTISATGGASSTSVVNVLNIANSSGTFNWSSFGGGITPAATGGSVASGAAVPEPATWLLAIMAALAGLVAWRRRT